MSRATSQMRELAVRLIAHETAEKASSEPNPPAVFRVCEKLRPHLSTLMGEAGFRAVLSRGLAVTKAEAPWVEALEVNANGSLEGWDRPDAQVAPEEMAASGALLVANVIGLLAAFIGDSLTLRLIRDVWPKLVPEN